jgi:hypothetical protein
MYILPETMVKCRRESCHKSYCGRGKSLELHTDIQYVREILTYFRPGAETREREEGRELLHPTI